MKNTKNIKYKMIACDLDGTLCGSDRYVSAENIKAIEKADGMGVLFVPATGRAFEEIPQNIRECPSIRYYITSNGAAVYDKTADEWQTCGIGHEKICDILDVFADYNVFIMFHANGRAHIDATLDREDYYSLCHMDIGWIEYIRESDVALDGFDTFMRSVNEAEMMCVFVSGDGEYEECASRLRALGGLIVTSSDAHNVEIVSDACGKGKAMLRLARSLGIEQKHTVAVGDSLNDSEMIKSAGLGVAMKNACNTLKDVAGYVADCDNDCHIMRYLTDRMEKHGDIR